jgi:hypothetical protein
MRATTKRKIDLVLSHAIGWFIIYALVLLVVLAVRGSGQIEVDPQEPVHKRVVYNYDPGRSNEEQERVRYENLDQRIMRVETQIDYLNRQVEALKPMETEARLVKLEQAIDYIKTLMWAIAVGLGGLMLDAAQKKLRPKSSRSRVSDMLDEEKA